MSNSMNEIRVVKEVPIVHVLLLYSLSRSLAAKKKQPYTFPKVIECIIDNFKNERRYTHIEFLRPRKYNTINTRERVH